MDSQFILYDLNNLVWGSIAGAEYWNGGYKGLHGQFCICTVVACNITGTRRPTWFRMKSERLQYCIILAGSVCLEIRQKIRRVCY